MRVWTVANQKGGVGKTTTAVALGGILAERGCRVLLVDLDPHGSMSAYFGHDPDAIELSVYDLFQHQGRVPEDLPRRLIRPTSLAGLSLIPASTLQATLERKMVGVEGMGLVIARTLAHLQADFDFVFLDNTPVLGVLLINALAASRHILIPVQTEFLALKGLERMLHTLAMVSRSQGREHRYTIIPTLFDRRTHASVSSFRMLRKTYQDTAWRYAIPVDTKFRDASRLGVVPSVLDAQTHGVKAYRRLLDDLLAEDASQQSAPLVGGRRP